MVRRTVDDGSEERARLGEVPEIASDAIIEVRSITANLCPGGPNHLGLRAATRFIIERVAEHTPITVEHLLISLAQNETAHDQIAIVRLIQDGLNNDIKHAEASHLTVDEQAASTPVPIIIEGDGKGFQPTLMRAAGKGGGSGLTGMSERAHLLGGRLRIHSAPGCGVRSVFDISLPGRCRQS
jgi:signal transduction histidine kinase